jgi:hypothetical protein
VIVSFQALSGQNIEDDKIVIRDCLGGKGFEVTDLSGNYIYTFIYIYIYIYIYINKRIYVHIYIHTYIYTYVYIYVSKDLKSLIY